MMILSLIARPALALLALGLAAQSPTPRSALDGKPAGVPLPSLPGIERSEPLLPPSPVRLERNAGLGDRFTAAGQSVRYPFAASAGELSIFELPATGFARGWTAALALRVLAADGGVLAQTEQSGGVQFRALLAFVAPRDGEYQLELAPTSEYFRYQLVRHSDYAARLPDDKPPSVPGERLHGWLADGADSARFLVPVRAGEELVVRVEATREEARGERSSARAAALEGSAGGAMGGRDMQAGRMMRGRGGDSIFPELLLELGATQELTSRGQSIARLTPTADGQLEVTVKSVPGQQAVLFDLVIERARANFTVSGTVIDADDQVCPNSELVFLLEPDLDPWARTRTDAQGRYSVQVPAGNWRIQLLQEGAPARSLRTGVEADTSARDLLF